jgi:hypothetical protein
MPQVKNGRLHDEDARDISLEPVQHWHIDSTSLNVAIHLHAERLSANPAVSSRHSFVLQAEQARQMIRDLSAAVLALDLQRQVERAADLNDPLPCVETPRRAGRVRDMIGAARSASL